MCLAIPGMILSVDAVSDPWNRMGKVRFGTIEKQVNLAYAPDADVGDYVLVHVGFALEKIDPDEAARIWEILREMEELHDITEPPEKGAS
jgi:hydrogenase expression/formation protein HypC